MIGVGRRLDESLSTKPFLDVQVVAGENSDPDLLGLRVISSTWIDDETIDIEVVYDNPVAISADKPPD